MTVKQQILNKLAEMQELLLEASCDEVQLAENDDVFKELNSYLNNFEQAVDYYVD